MLSKKLEKEGLVRGERGEGRSSKTCCCKKGGEVGANGRKKRTLKW